MDIRKLNLMKKTIMALAIMLSPSIVHAEVNVFRHVLSVNAGQNIVPDLLLPKAPTGPITWLGFYQSYEHHMGLLNESELLSQSLILGLNPSGTPQNELPTDPYPVNTVGSISVQGTKLTTLDSLSTLRTVHSSVVVDNNSELENIDGLSKVAKANYGLSVSDNAKLSSITGLRGITQSGNNINIKGNASLMNIHPLSNISFYNT